MSSSTTNFYKGYLDIQIKSTKDHSQKRLDIEYNQFDNNFSEIISKLSIKKSTFLEIGFGSGYLLRYLSKFKKFKNVLGVEISKETTSYVKNKIHKNVFFTSNTLKFLRESRKFDVIFMLDVLEHIPRKDTVNYLQTINDSLTKNGIFIARVPNSANPFNQNVFADFTHEFFYNQKSLEQVLRMAGFQNIKVLPWKEENITLHSKVTNKTAPLIGFIWKVISWLSRSSLFPNTFYSRDIVCIASKGK